MVVDRVRGKVMDRSGEVTDRKEKVTDRITKVTDRAEKELSSLLDIRR